MKVIPHPFSGMSVTDDPSLDIHCPCGNTFFLHWNGGELDRRKCECGLTYWTESTGTILRIR